MRSLQGDHSGLAFCLWWQACPPHTQSRVQRETGRGESWAPGPAGSRKRPQQWWPALVRAAWWEPSSSSGWAAPDTPPGNLLHCHASSCVSFLRGHEKETSVLQAPCWVSAATSFLPVSNATERAELGKATVRDHK